MNNPRSKKAVVTEQIHESASLCAELAGQAGVIVEIAEEMTRAFTRGRKVLLFGNGGSAADAEHIACELAGKFTLFRDPLPAVALTTNTSALTAIGNDFGYEEVFARQLRGLVAKGDVVIGLSTSGASPNVIRAIITGTTVRPNFGVRMAAKINAASIKGRVIKTSTMRMMTLSNLPP